MGELLAANSRQKSISTKDSDYVVQSLIKTMHICMNIRYYFFTEIKFLQHINELI